MKLFFLLLFIFINHNYSFNFEHNFINSNIGKVYPEPKIVSSPSNLCAPQHGIMSQRPINLRCLTIRPRPLLKNKKKYLIDIDGTICDTYKNDYFLSTSKVDIINYFNKLYDDGNEIHYWTNRGSLSGKNWDKFTVYQLKKWNCKYDTINTGKPHYDVWVDDKSINIKDIKLNLRDS
jgi:hypothetical protein